MGSHDIAERGGEGIHPKAMPVILTSDELRSAMSGCVRHGMRRSRCCGRYRMMLWRSAAAWIYLHDEWMASMVPAAECRRSRTWSQARNQQRRGAL